MKELLTAVREGRRQDVPALLARLNPAERRSALVELKALRKEARDWPWNERRQTRGALYVAGAGCQTGAAGCAVWLGGRDLLDWTGAPYRSALKVLSDRDPAWLTDVAYRLAARPTVAEAAYELIVGLVRLAGCPVPTSDPFVRGWATTASATPWLTQRTRPLVEALRDDPFLPVLLPRLFELPELPPQVTWFEEETKNPCHWLAALTTLVDEGRLERSELVDICVARLLRGGRPGDLRFVLALLRRLAVTEREETEHLADWIGMAADGVSTVAGHAQEVLARLDERGELPVRSLADVSGSVLFRTEKKLVRAQLMLMGKALRRDRSTVDELLPVVAVAFGHPDTGIQERALKLVARHLPAVGARAREELALAAEQLSPMLRTTAEESFGEALGGPPATEPYEELLPPPPAPQPLEPAPATLPELVEEVVGSMSDGSWNGRRRFDAPAFERMLDGLVRHAHADRSALLDALRGVLSDRWWFGGERNPHRERWFVSRAGVELVVAVLLDRISKEAVKAGRASKSSKAKCVHTALEVVRTARLWEAADALVEGRGMPFLLATPSWHTGALDADVLVDRLRAYQRLGVRPGEVDFGQALLRVRRGGQQRAVAAASALGTPEGDRLAAWLRADEPLARVHRFDLEPENRRGTAPAPWTHRVLMASDEHTLVRRRDFSNHFRFLSRPHTPDHRICYHWNDQAEFWTASLPHDAETLAAWLLPALSVGTTEEIRGTALPLPPLAELDAPAGEAVHLTVAYGLASRHSEDRLSSVDALLTLAARGRLDPALLGRGLTALLDSGLAKPSRLAESVRTAAETGACRTVLSVLVEVLPGLLALDKAPRGLSDLLAVGAECAERCGAVRAEPIPGLAATAARGGSSQLVRQAIRLRTAWDRTADLATAPR
ncbi:DUF7824 domain-containing protein [Streptomyces sp. PTD5-9]|uniref:DUF7824 domain-containing protein n=1 Tax=Streptomyces sp. PTD5-9 TaxID=3120150 RepID=UPI00300A6346